MVRTRIQAFTSTAKGARPASADTPLAGELFVNYADKQLGIVNVGATTNTDLIAVRFFTTTTDYAIGDYVISAGQLYRCKAAVTSGTAFDATKWDAVTPGSGGGGVTDGDKGDVVVSGSGATWLLDAAVTASITAKAPLASPAFTGNPTAPTPTAGDNDTSLATTAFVKAAVDAAIAVLPVREQWFDLATLASKDIPVPTWAKGVQIVGSHYATVSSAVTLRVSFDGTTFAAGAAEYQNAGGSHNTGSAAYANNALATGSSIFLTLGADSLVLPQAFEAEMNLARPSTTTLFHCKSFGTVYDSAATNLYRVHWWTGNPIAALSSALAIKALRLLPSAGTFGAGSYVQIRWLGDPTAGTVIGAPQYFYPGASSPGGSATQNNNGITVGMRFTPLVAGKITGIRWYNGAIEAGTSGKVAVYSDAGALLASASFSGLSTAIGWRLVALDYTIVANTTYRCAVWLTIGSDAHAWYMAQANKFASAGITVAGVMTMPVGPTQNVFDEPDNSDIVFPNTAFNATGYGVDVEFRTIT